MRSHIKTVWRSPRATVRNALDENLGGVFIPLTAIGGMVHNYNQVMSRNTGLPDDVSILGFYTSIFLIGAVSGVVKCLIYAYLLALTGRLLGGDASSRSARMVLALASIPSLPLLAIIIPIVLVAGDSLVLNSREELLSGSVGIPLQLVYLGYGVAQIVMGVWAMVIGVTALSEAFSVTARRSFAIIMLPAVFLIMLMVGIPIIFGAISSL